MKIPHETTPKGISSDIVNCASIISPNQTMSYVTVVSNSLGNNSNCFINVSLVVNKLGGKAVMGWAVWQWANIMIEFEAHAIWETPEGEYLDVTSHETETAILFLPDPSVVYSGKVIPSKRFPLSSSPLVAEMISLQETKDYFLSRNEKPDEQILYKLISINQQLKKDVGRNDLCPCQSGMKYKNCCGRFA